MDPLSHVALGRTLIAVAWDDANRRAVAVAGTLGALSPDLDAVFMPAGWDRYLRVHEIGTHTVLGTAACAALTAGIVRAFARDSAWRVLAGAAWLGAASHVLLDLLSSARLRLLWPLVDTQFAMPLVAMADPWLAGFLIAGAIACVAARRHRRRLAILTLAASSALLAMKGVGLVRAAGAYHDAPDGRVASQAHIVEAQWASLSRWRVFDRTSTHVRAWTADANAGPAQLVFSWPLERESPLVAASRSLSTTRNFLRAHQLSFAAVIDQDDTERWVLWSDVRFCTPAPRERPRTDLRVTAGGVSLECALWAGGSFGPDGQPLLEIVKIGGFIQARRPQ